MSSRIGTLLAALSALLLSGPCLAQGTGVIYGTDSDPTGAGVARITSAGSARVLQFALKLLF